MPVVISLVLVFFQWAHPVAASPANLVVCDQRHQLHTIRLSWLLYDIPGRDAAIRTFVKQAETLRRPWCFRARTIRLQWFEEEFVDTLPNELGKPVLVYFYQVMTASGRRQFVVAIDDPLGVHHLSEVAFWLWMLATNTGSVYRENITAK